MGLATRRSYDGQGIHFSGLRATLSLFHQTGTVSASISMPGLAIENGGKIQGSKTESGENRNSQYTPQQR